MQRPNFDDWAELFRSDPELFEVKRKQFLAEYIADYWSDDPDKQQRAEATLWRMEQNYRHIVDPVERFNVVVVEFWKQVEKLKHSLSLL